MCWDAIGMFFVTTVRGLLWAFYLNAKVVCNQILSSLHSANLTAIPYGMHALNEVEHHVLNVPSRCQSKLVKAAQESIAPMLNKTGSEPSDSSLCELQAPGNLSSPVSPASCPDPQNPSVVPTEAQSVLRALSMPIYVRLRRDSCSSTSS